MAQENPLWEDNLIQFARLLSEIMATCSDLDWSGLCESMDLELSDIDEIFDRAELVWNKAKERNG